MTKIERLELIKTRAKIVIGSPIPGILPVSRREIAIEGETLLLRLGESMNDSLTQGDEIEISVSRLAFDNAEMENESEESFLLTRPEKNRLTRELRTWREISV